MIIYRIDVLQELKKKGYNTNRIRKEKLISEGALTKIRNGQVVGMKSLESICELLEKQPGSIIKYVPDGNKTE